MNSNSTDRQATQDQLQSVTYLDQYHCRINIDQLQDAMNHVHQVRPIVLWLALNWVTLQQHVLLGHHESRSLHHLRLNWSEPRRILCKNENVNKAHEWNCRIEWMAKSQIMDFKKEKMTPTGISTTCDSASFNTCHCANSRLHEV